MKAIMYAVVVAIVSWMVFGSMNELTSAHAEDGCCGRAECGASQVTNLVWWANLMIAIVATVAALYGAAKMTLQGRMLPTIPFLPVV